MRLRAGVAIDLGTVNTLVCVAGRGLVVEEPSAIALDRETGRVTAVGHEADALAGKDPQDVEVIHPLRDGVVADLDAASAMLQAFVRRARQARRPRPRAAAGRGDAAGPGARRPAAWLTLRPGRRRPRRAAHG